jgi:hypothetical protein
VVTHESHNERFPRWWIRREGLEPWPSDHTLLLLHMGLAKQVLLQVKIDDTDQLKRKVSGIVEIPSVLSWMWQELFQQIDVQGDEQGSQ